jgi:hypothetical protein
MKNKRMLAAAILLFSFTGCVDHEIIPAPTPHVELVCNFKGLVNGTDIELTQNVQGYYLSNTQSKIILPSPAASSAVYFADIKSDQSLRSVMVGLGSINWDASASSEPTLALFNVFMTANTNPAYSTAGSAGFEVKYRDNNGDIWTSKPNDLGQAVTFSNIVQESDESGDYSKFTCTFTTTVYHTFMITTVDPITGAITVTPNEQSLIIANGIYKGWFKR